MAEWIVARTCNGRESWAAENVHRQGRDFYLPRTISTIRRNGQLSAVARPLFPNYLFVKIHDQQWHFLLGTFGVQAVVLSGARPSPMPEYAIEELRKRENREGYVLLPKKDTPFAIGEQLKIRKGPLANRIGIYEGMAAKDTQKVLLDFLGRKTSVLIATDLLEQAA
jgi:transcriptional antiterminator RfaH